MGWMHHHHHHPVVAVHARLVVEFSWVGRDLLSSQAAVSWMSCPDNHHRPQDWVRFQLEDCLMMFWRLM
jgi:hypothetical protein